MTKPAILHRMRRKKGCCTWCGATDHHIKDCSITAAKDHDGDHVVVARPLQPRLTRRPGDTETCTPSRSPATQRPPLEAATTAGGGQSRGAKQFRDPAPSWVSYANVIWSWASTIGRVANPNRRMSTSCRSWLTMRNKRRTTPKREKMATKAILH